MYQTALAIVCLGIFLFSPVYSMERFDVLTTQELKTMLDERASGAIDFLLVNTLDELISADSSIPGSIKLPWYKVNELSHMLGTDKEKLIVTYCMGYR